jgi:hypothetical protein
MFAFAEPAKIGAVEIYDIRSLMGEAFTAAAKDGRAIVFLDDVGLENALHFFDLIMTETKNREVIEALEQKRVSRALFATGNSCEAYLVALIANDAQVRFDSATTSLTCLVDCERRERFVAQFNTFVLGHELAHTAQSADPRGTEPFRIKSRELATSKGMFFSAGQIELAPQKLREADIDDELRTSMTQFMESGEFSKYYARSADELLDADFVEEVACDLMAIDALFRKQHHSSEQELAEHLVIASVANFLGRHRLLELDILEYLRDEIQRYPAAADKTAVRRLNERGTAFSNANSDRFAIVQRFQIRTLVVVSFVERLWKDRADSTDPASIEAKLDGFLWKMMNGYGTLVGPFDDRGYALLAASFAAAADYRHKLLKKGLSNSEIERQTRAEYLALNGLSSAQAN